HSYRIAKSNMQLFVWIVSLSSYFFKKIVLPYVEVIPIDESDIEIMENYLIKYDIKPSYAIHLATMEKKSIAHIVSEDEEFDRIKEIHRIWLSKF
ncbi:MAG: type II toxin-antitoxin system VapC family toxin, partial [Nitrososphaerales archaeon]